MADPGVAAGGPRSRLGLRARVALSFAAIALALSVLLGAGTFLVVRNLLLSEFEAGALDQTLVDARVVAATLRSDERTEAQVLAAIRPPVRSRPFLYRDGDWFSASLQVSAGDLPTDLVDLVVAGSPARQRFAIDGEPFFAVGIPLEPERSAYLEVFSLAGLAGTLNALGQTLLVAGTATTAAGAGLGWWLARRVLRPLRRVTNVAEEIAAGRLSSRLDEAIDPDLAGLSASFNRMADSLEQRLDREARFASDVSHELRSPLTTLRTSVEVLQRRSHELSDPAREALALLSAELDRFERLVLELIEISQHDAGRVELELEEIQVAELVRMVMRRLGRDDVPVILAPSVLGSRVRVDTRRIERVIANLLSNADVHGGGARALVVESGEDGLRIAVEDHGPGIPPEDREIVFDRFSRGSAAGRRQSSGGAGLGLALAQENARLHQGGVRIEDRVEGPGARVVLELPQVEE